MRRSSVPHQHRLEREAVERAEARLDRAVGRALGLLEHELRERHASCEPRAERPGQRRDLVPGGARSRVTACRSCAPGTRARPSQRGPRWRRSRRTQARVSSERSSWCPHVDPDPLSSRRTSTTTARRRSRARRDGGAGRRRRVPIVMRDGGADARRAGARRRRAARDRVRHGDRRLDAAPGAGAVGEGGYVSLFEIDPTARRRRAATSSGRRRRPRRPAPAGRPSRAGRASTALCDLAFIDAIKAEYAAYVDLALPLLRPRRAAGDRQRADGRQRRGGRAGLRRLGAARHRRAARAERGARGAG